ncbi:MAG TPA: hypothetical protein VF528_03080 [Pyrinomonadaceae bacterium]|jgi:hypothetical protein
MNSYVGTFESHVTVNAGGFSHVERFRQLCEELGLKSIIIELSRGVSRTQPMTATHHRGSLEDVLAEVRAIAQSFERNGFAVKRVKVEAEPDNDGVPHTDEESSQLPPTNYFEFHALVTLPIASDLSTLAALCVKHDAHLSSSMFKRLPEGRAQRFVTMRVYGAGRTRAADLFQKLAGDIGRAGYTISREVREYVVYDSNLLLDAGWINPHGPAAGE